MNKYKTLEEKIKSMTAKEIILTMVDSLKNPVTRVDMDTFGFIQDNVCYGCAATNTICRLGGFEPSNELIEKVSAPKYRISGFISYFEDAIDFLRVGDIDSYNEMADFAGFAQIKDSGVDLPEIDTLTYQDQEVLQSYIDLANAQ